MYERITKKTWVLLSLGFLIVVILWASVFFRNTITDQISDTLCHFILGDNFKKEEKIIKKNVNPAQEVVNDYIVAVLHGDHDKGYSLLSRNYKRELSLATYSRRMINSYFNYAAYFNSLVKTTIVPDDLNPNSSFIVTITTPTFNELVPEVKDEWQKSPVKIVTEHMIASVVNEKLLDGKIDYIQIKKNYTVVNSNGKFFIDRMTFRSN